MSNNRLLLISNSSKSVLNFRGKLIEAFQKAGLEVIVLLSDSNENEEIVKILHDRGCKVESFHLNRAGVNVFDDLRTLSDLYKIISRYQPDYVLGYTIKPVIYGSIAAKFAGVSKIYSLITGLGYAFISLDNPDHKVSYVQKIVFKLYKLALSFCTKVFFQNSDDAELFHKMKLVNSEKTIVVNGSGVDLSHYTYDITILNNTHAETPLTFTMLGRIIGDKGIREYIGAVRKIKEKYGNRVIFQLAGGLDSNPTAIQQAELDSWVKEGLIKYLGRLKDVRPTITNSHVFVLPSYREGTSRSILEAMSIGRPIITTNVPGCRQLVENGKNGFLAEAKSIESLEDAIEKIINLSTEELVQMGVHSRRIVEEKYDVHKVNAHMMREMGLN